MFGQQKVGGGPTAGGPLGPIYRQECPGGARSNVHHEAKAEEVTMTLTYCARNQPKRAAKKYCLASFRKLSSIPCDSGFSGGHPSKSPNDGVRHHDPWMRQ